MRFSPELADIRFGCGLSPAVAPPHSIEAVLSGLQAPDTMATRFPIDGFATFQTRVEELSDLRRKAREERANKQHQKKVRKANRAAMSRLAHWMGQSMLRWSWSETPFRERLVAFWADHFTAVGKRSPLTAGVSPFIESAIRPNIAGNFADLLIAASTHPMMLHYLDQSLSIGPGSRAAGKNPRRSGLNENLAREVLELHTLGVGGPYSQADVRQLAELFTGMSLDRRAEFVFRRAWAEPGAEQILGRSYGGARPRLAHIHDALRDIALHPATAAYIAQKLAVHFVSDTPAPDLVAHLTARFLASGGDLMQTYAALLEHPSAWAPELRNVKPHIDYVATSCRALALSPDRTATTRAGHVRRTMIGPLRVMGQFWQRPGGPDGWPEEDAAWVTPQGIAARLQWAMSVPQLLRPDLPDPVAFVGTTLGSYASEPVRFAASAAESKAEAIGLVLSAPAFQRR